MISNLFMSWIQTVSQLRTALLHTLCNKFFLTVFPLMSIINILIFKYIHHEGQPIYPQLCEVFQYCLLYLHLNITLSWANFSISPLFNTKSMCSPIYIFFIIIHLITILCPNTFLFSFTSLFALAYTCNCFRYVFSIISLLHFGTFVGLTIFLVLPFSFPFTLSENIFKLSIYISCIHFIYSSESLTICVFFVSFFHSIN